MAVFSRAITRLMEEKKEGRAFVPPEEETSLVEPDAREPHTPPVEELPPPVDRFALIEAFTSELLEKSGMALRAAVPSDQIPALARSAFDFVERRGELPYAVRVFAPDLHRDGWSGANLVVEATLPDCPFIVQTLRESVLHLDAQVDLLIHPLFGVRRGRGGSVTEIGPPTLLAARESFVHMHVSGSIAASDLQEVLAERLAQIVAATRDYASLRARAAELATELRVSPLPAPWNEETTEVADFLQWLLEKNFVFLGFREYDLSTQGSGRALGLRPGTGLGILRSDETSGHRLPRQLDESMRRWVNEPPLLLVTRTTAISPIHRLVPMDYVGVKRLNAAGTVVGEYRFLGLFTSKALHAESSTVPVVRTRIQSLLDREGALPESHDSRELRDLSDGFGKTELLGGRVEDLHEMLNGIRAARGRQSLRVFARPGSARTGVFVVVTLPGERYSAELQERVTAHLHERLGGPILDERAVLSDDQLARIHYHVRVTPETLQRMSALRLEEELGILLRTWDDQLRYLLRQAHAPAEAERLTAYYAQAFPESYKSQVTIGDAVADVAALEAVRTSGEMQIERRPGRDGIEAFKLYTSGERLVLSDFIPVLENLGLRVFDENFVDLQSEANGVRIHTFWVKPIAPPSPTLADVGPAPLVDALRAVRRGSIANDALNRLTLLAGLDWRAVDVLRAYTEHARQTGMTPARAAVVEALVGNPDSARALYELFAARFDPAHSHQSAIDRVTGAMALAKDAFLATLERVESLAHDRLLRGLAAAVEATVRTNAFAPGRLTPAPSDPPESRAVVFKFDCSLLPQLPEPRPLFETYVHAAIVEGIHLRAGRVARGGIRLSDRPDDFRTEVLGLMKTQVVKNAVIVPTGAKGGFVVKGPGKPGAPEIELAYRTFIGGLLSIADNFDGGRADRPRGLIVYDEDDPYLVVAADKGTATFSDIANEIAARYGFWLGDAFASGGSNGYDHKKQAITARGAWECVRQHFRELGRDVERETVDVIGIGDMSGDVFGNGLLRSPTLRLRAAFDHRHVFLDPEPVQEAAFAERERLFRLPRSSWADYDSRCLGPGGGVFPRGAKNIALSAEARAMLGFEDGESPSGEAVVRAVLTMGADLLWNGGIGTYVKATDETAADAGDPTNDAVRVDASQLRVRVVGEGGNLGLTQRARIEYALRGGRIDTDAIDNSAGVDLSDHEVNLKIALQSLVRRNEMTVADRNRLLAELTDEVCERVLRDNRRQARVLGYDQLRSQTRLIFFREVLEGLETRGAIDRGRERLPSREALRTRRAAYPGLTRPELAVLLAHAKIEMQRELIASPLVDDRDVSSFLSSYFPRELRERFAFAIKDHPLRREIVAVEIGNLLVDTMGMTFGARLAGETGRPLPDIVKAWVLGLKVSGAENLIRDIEAAQNRLSAAAEARCFHLLERALERATRWVLATQDLNVEIGDLLAPLRVVTELLGTPGDDGHAAALALEDDESRKLVEEGLPVEVAVPLVRLTGLTELLEVAALAGELAASPADADDALAAADRIVDTEWLTQALEEARTVDDRWQRRAAAALVEDLLFGRRNLARTLLAPVDDRRVPIAERAAAFEEERATDLERTRQLLQQMRGGSQPSFPALVIAVRELVLLGA